MDSYVNYMMNRDHLEEIRREAERQRRANELPRNRRLSLVQSIKHTLSR